MMVGGVRLWMGRVVEGIGRYRFAVELVQSVIIYTRSC